MHLLQRTRACDKGTPVEVTGSARGETLTVPCPSGESGIHFFSRHPAYFREAPEGDYAKPSYKHLQVGALPGRTQGGRSHANAQLAENDPAPSLHVVPFLSAFRVLLGKGGHHFPNPVLVDAWQLPRVIKMGIGQAEASAGLNSRRRREDDAVAGQSQGANEGALRSSE
jgi:hypothetical protein